MASPYDPAVAAATREIKKWGDPCTWQSRVSGTLADATKPWDKAADIITETLVHILFSADDLEDRQLRYYLANTETQRGLVNGMMHIVNFVPSMKDTVIRDGEELIIATLDVLKPGPIIIFHKIEFKL
jgi:hypothetical protein